MLRRAARAACSAVLVALLLPAPGCAPGSEGEPAPRSPAPTPDTVLASADAAGGDGTTVYVPVYSHIYHQDGSRRIDLTATLSIRNTDPAEPLVVTGVRYYDSSGRLVRSYLQTPLRLGPLASEAFVVEERDEAGGVGANFLVDWSGRAGLSPPIVEAVMISTASAQGISFVSRGQVVRGPAASSPLDR